MDCSQRITEQEITLDQKRWAIAFLMVGCMTFFLSPFIDPVFASLMVILGILNLLINGRGIYLINSPFLIILALVTLTQSIGTVMVAGSVTIITIIGILLGLLEGFWGVGEFRKFIHHQKRNVWDRTEQS